jgi:hypothetical protein
MNKTAFAEIRTTTKPLVDALLAMNTLNRPIKKRVVEKYARDIKAGKWVLTNQGIGVSESGVLLDGQHRLEAIKACGYPPVPVLVVGGLPDECRLAVDQHAKRSARDMLHFAFDYRVSNSAPAIATALICSKSSNGWSGGQTMSEIYECILDYSEEIEAVVSLPKNVKNFAAPYLAAFIDCIKSGIGDIDKLAKFINDIETGEMLSRTDPQFHLRNLVKSTRMTGGGSVVRKERFEKAKKAFTAYVNGQKMGVLRA